MRCVLRGIVGPGIVGLAVFAAPARAEPPVEPVQLRPGERQLFLDDELLERIDGLRRVVHAPDRHPANPVITADEPWEENCSVYGTALYDESLGKFRLWYLTMPRDRGLKPLELGAGRQRAPHTTLAAYAESEDGVHWIKPPLGQFPYDGQTANNLLDIGRYNCEGISVLYDPRDENPQRRFKAAYWDHGSGGWDVRDGKPYCMPGEEDGFCVAFSPDGIHWTPSEHNPVLKVYCDTNQNVVYDPRLERYVAFSRFHFGRKLARSESTDFVHWSEPRLVLECDADDGPETQVYGAGVDLYEGVYLAMVWIYREGGDGKIDTQLATSRDGIRWTRVGDRATWLSLGDDQSWEGGMVRSVERIIPRGDRLFVYYGGVHGPHRGPRFPSVERLHRGAIGLVTLRRDGFVSLRADEQRGSLVTKPLVWPDGALELNYRTDPDGHVRVVVYPAGDESEAVMARSRPLRGDATTEPLAWEVEPAAELVGRPVRLGIELHGADVFAYGWRPGGGPETVAQ